MLFLTEVRVPALPAHTAFVGTEAADELGRARLVLGIQEAGALTSDVVSVPEPCIIQAVRALHLVRELSAYEPGLLSVCWQAMILGPCDSEVTEAIQDYLGDKDVAEVRERLFRGPDQNTLERLADLLWQQRITVDLKELDREIKAGRIVNLYRLERYIARHKRYLSERRDDIISRPLLPEQSLGHFLHTWGVRGIINEPPGAMYGQDWTHITPVQLDELVQRGRLLHNRPTELWLLKGSRAAAVTIKHRGVFYTLPYADYKDGAFVIGMLFVEAGDTDVKVELPLDEVRRLLGDPSLTERARRLVRRLVR